MNTETTETTELIKINRDALMKKYNITQEDLDYKLKHLYFYKNFIDSIRNKKGEYITYLTFIRDQIIIIPEIIFYDTNCGNFHVDEKITYEDIKVILIYYRQYQNITTEELIDIEQHDAEQLEKYNKDTVQFTGKDKLLKKETEKAHKLITTTYKLTTQRSTFCCAAERLGAMRTQTFTSINNLIYNTIINYMINDKNKSIYMVNQSYDKIFVNEIDKKDNILIDKKDFLRKIKDNFIRMLEEKNKEKETEYIVLLVILLDMLSN